MTVKNRSLFALAALVVIFAGRLSTASAQVPTCSTLFANTESVPALLEQAKFIVSGLPTTAIAATARLKLIDEMGAKDALALFGSDFNSWPMYLGTSPGGHVIVALGQRDGAEIRLLSYKRLDISPEEFRRRQDLDFEVALGKVAKPDGHETVRAWLERTESAFEETVSTYSRDTGFWLLRDGNEKRLESAVLIYAGAFGKFDQPWLVRSTRSLTPAPDRKSAIMSEPKEMVPLVERLLKMKAGK